MTLGDKIAYYHQHADDSGDLRLAALRNRALFANRGGRSAFMTEGMEEGGTRVVHDGATKEGHEGRVSQGGKVAPPVWRTPSTMSLAVCVSVSGINGMLFHVYFLSQAYFQ